MSDDNFIARWSRRKVEARKGDEKLDSDPRRDDAGPANAVPAANGITPAQAVAPAQAGGAEPREALPPLESLTSHSDFSPFMREGVDPALKGRALKTLFGDPALYPMDGLDVYIDDYSKPDPLPEGWLEKLNQYAALDSHNQPERDAEGCKALATPASPPPAESAASPPTVVAEPPSASAPSDTSAAPAAPSDAMNRAGT